ncbi:MAG: molybdopterin dinucleotide binding domain-containing protein, partial [Propionivibrio sp.]
NEDGRARFIATGSALTADQPDARHPFRLISGRLRDQWHGMSRTGRVPRLFAHEPEPCLQLNPADLARRGWASGTLMSVSNRRGTIVLPLAGSDEVRPGQAFVAMHWGRHSLSHDGVNALTPPAFDPVSKQPELKHTAVRIEPAALPWRMTVLRSAGGSADANEQVLAWRARLQTVLGEFNELGDSGFAALTLDGRDRPLVALRLAAAAPLPDAQIEALARMLDMPAAICLNYRDGARHIVKRAIVEAGRLTGILLAGEDQASGWLRTALRDGVAIDDLRRWLFAPRSTPPLAAGEAMEAMTSRRVICNCFNVSSEEIAREIAAGAAGTALADVQAKLKCGTSCGSCLTEIRRMMMALPSDG